MIDPKLKDKVVLITRGNNPYGIGAAIARAFAQQGASVFIHYFRRNIDISNHKQKQDGSKTPGLSLFFEQQQKDTSEVIKSIHTIGGKVDSFEGDLANPTIVKKMFDRAENVLGQVDILVNNAAEYSADTFLPNIVLKAESALWEDGPLKSTISIDSHDRHFAVNTCAVALLMAEFAKRLIERKKNWGRIINISADCAWGCPGEISYRASKYALESYTRSAAAELGPYGITVNIISPGPVQTGYISPATEKVIIPEIPLRRVGKPEDIADAVIFFASEQAEWITGQLLFVHGGHRMALGR